MLQPNNSRKNNEYKAKSL